MNITKGNNRSRLFVQDAEGRAWQIFSLSQGKKDGSIYLSSPEFSSFEWLTFEIKDNKLESFKVQQQADGHLSFHGHGQVHVKERDVPYKLPISGQYLLKSEENTISLRHLFTFFPKQPRFLPDSPAFNRAGDQLMTSNESMRPFVMVGFAFPRKGWNINLRTSFSIDDIENVPGGVLGTHLFPLLHHDIFLFLYRTKNMDNWPKRSMLQYLDGINVPMFIGEANHHIRVEFRQPEYSLSNNALDVWL